MRARRMLRRRLNSCCANIASNSRNWHCRRAACHGSIRLRGGVRNNEFYFRFDASLPRVIDATCSIAPDHCRQFARRRWRPCRRAERLVDLRRAIVGRIVFTHGFGVEGQLIFHWICEHDLDIDVVTLDTGRLFPETYTLWAETERRYGRRIRAIYPERAALEATGRPHGIDGIYDSKQARHACCNVRKVKPLDARSPAPPPGSPACAPTRPKPGARRGWPASTPAAASSSSTRSTTGRARPWWLDAAPPPTCRSMRCTPGLRLDRLRAVHARGCARRTGAQRPLVVGAGRRQGMRSASATSRRRARQGRLRLIVRPLRPPVPPRSAATADAPDRWHGCRAG